MLYLRHNLSMALKDRLRPLDKKRRNELGEKSVKFAHKFLYPYVTRRFSVEDVVCLNYGYEEDPPMDLRLNAADERHRYCINLYHRTATQVDLCGRQVLEVGCGHGGGASYLTRALRPASYTGLDLNPTGVAFCKERHHVGGLDFVQGDAENLPFPDQSFDAVINVESSHCYPRFSRFLEEAARVLRPGGHFLYTDCRVTRTVSEWEEALASAPMRMISRVDIEPEIARGMERTLPQSIEVISRSVPKSIRGFARVQAAWGRNTLVSGGLAYRLYCFAKD
jgi:ubiquinone/menaquinone biosynthesis C-methylase UbiE